MPETSKQTIALGGRLPGRYDARTGSLKWKTLTVVTMDHVLTATFGLALLYALGATSVAKCTLQATTVLTAWRWAIAASFVWLLAFGVSFTVDVPQGYSDLMWYSVALVSLCPAIAVLGARRPGTSAWTWFVILPMLAVLGWPMLTVWGHNLRSASFQLEIPQLAGFVLVLLMSAGNYIGTRYWASACLYAMALCLLVAPVSAVAPQGLSADASRSLAGLVLGAAVGVADVSSRRRRPAPSSLDGLWEDYRNLFGIVWSRRLQDRLNAVASQQKWPLRVAPSGFHWSQTITREQRQETEIKVEQSLRWMLRRFVDPEWIDSRLHPLTGESPRDQVDLSA